MTSRWGGFEPLWVVRSVAFFRLGMRSQNPYQAITVAELVPRHNGAKANAWLWWPVFCYPGLMLAAIFGSWGLTYLSLGRPPGHGEYPHNEILHALVHGMCFCSAIGFLVGPVICVAGLLWSVTHPFGRAWSCNRRMVTRTVCLGIYLLMLLNLICWVSNESLGVMVWFWD